MSDPYEAGMEVRREVLGDAHVDRAVARTTDFSRDFQEYITLSRGARSGPDQASIAAPARRSRFDATAIGRKGELELHVRGALRNGLTPDEISRS